MRMLMCVIVHKCACVLSTHTHVSMVYMCTNTQVCERAFASLCFCACWVCVYRCVRFRAFTQPARSYTHPRVDGRSHAHTLSLSSTNWDIWQDTPANNNLAVPMVNAEGIFDAHQAIEVRDTASYG